MPDLYIIAGPNGAGKTTSAYKILPSLKVIEFVNADNIAKGISPYNPEAVAIQAGRVMLKRIYELADGKNDFAIETTLTTRSYDNLIKKCIAAGYRITLVFIWLSSAELAMKRVRERVIKGGHNIPKKIIERRYHKGLNNLKNIFLPLCNRCIIADNSGTKLTIVAVKSGDKIKISDNKTYRIIFNG